MELTTIGIIILSIMIIVTLLIGMVLRRVVPTNMVHIVQSSKTTTPYGRGKAKGNTYYEWPSWVPFIGVSVTTFPESIFQVSLTNYEAYDTARLPFIVDITAFFRVDSAETAAQRVSSFDELHSQLQEVLQGSVRRILATNYLEDIMKERSKLGDEFTKEVQTNIAEWGVLPVKMIEFMDLRDSSKGNVIADIMAKEQSRIEKESRTTVAENRKEAELKEIDAKQQVDVQKQQAEQQVGMRTAEKDKQVGIAKEQANQDIQEQTKITAEKLMAVKLVEEEKQAEIKKKVAVINAEEAAEVNIKIADGEKQSAELRATAIVAVGNASAEAEKAMLMAPVDTQISLAKEIGENVGYQKYLITIEQVKVSKDVGMEMAKALQQADIKVIANGTDPQSGLNSAINMFGSSGAKTGMDLNGLLSTLGASEEGSNLLNSVNTFLSKTHNVTGVTKEV